MDGSGIRSFCRSRCAGACCFSVADYTCVPYSEERCDSRLPCSLYICDYVEAHVINEQGEEIVDLLRKLDNIICDFLRNKEQKVNIYIIPSDEYLMFEFIVPDLSVLDNSQAIRGLTNGYSN